MWLKFEAVQTLVYDSPFRDLRRKEKQKFRVYNISEEV